MIFGNFREELAVIATVRYAAVQRSQTFLSACHFPKIFLKENYLSKTIILGSVSNSRSLNEVCHAARDWLEQTQR